MNMRAMRNYQSIQVETAVSAANPGGLILLVFDRVVDHLRAAVTAIEQDRDAGEAVSKALDLIGKGLLASLDRERGGEIAANLASLYDWAMRHILQARLKRDTAMFNDVLRVMESLREAWLHVAEQPPETSPA